MKIYLYGARFVPAGRAKTKHASEPYKLFRTKDEALAEFKSYILGEHDDDDCNRLDAEEKRVLEDVSKFLDAKVEIGDNDHWESWSPPWGENTEFCACKIAISVDLEDKEGQTK